MGGRWRSVRASRVGLVLLIFALYRIDAILGILQQLFMILRPFFLGILIALLVNLPMRFLERRLSFLSAPGLLRRLRRAFCLTVSLLFLLAVVSVTLVVIVPQVAAAVESLIGAVPGLLRQLEKWLLERNASLRSVFGLSEADETSVREQFERAYGFLLGGLSYSSHVVRSAAQVLANAGVALVFAVYLLFSKERIRAQFETLTDAWLGLKRGEKVRRIAGMLVNAYSSFLGGQSLQALISAAVTWLALFAAGMPYAVLISLITFLMAFIPIFGSFIAGLAGLLLVLSADPSRALWFAALFFLVQQITGSLVYPRIMGNAVRLPAIWILVSVALGGGILGFAGMLLSIPLAGVAYRLLAEETFRRRRGPPPLSEARG